MYNKPFFLKNTAISLLIALILCGCGQNSKTPTPEQQSGQDKMQSEKVPENLKNIEKSIESIISELNGPAIFEKDEKQKDQEGNIQKDKTDEKDKSSDKGNENQTNEGTDQQSEQKDNQNSTNNSSDQENKPKATPQPKPRDPWSDILFTVNNLHYQWNSFMPSATKKGATRTVIDNFSNALNNLTNSIISKNSTNTLISASNLYSFIPDLYSLYRTENSSEIKRVRHYSRNSIINSANANWPQATADMNNLKASWNICKSTLSKIKQDELSKMDYSISELEKVISQKNQALVNIKGRVLLSNIQAIEKEMDKNSKQVDTQNTSS